MRYIFGILFVIGGGFMGLVAVAAGEAGSIIFANVFFFLGLYMIFKRRKRK